MIGRYFSMIFDFFSTVLTIDFGLGVDLGSVILAFFTILAFIRFFVRPILGGALTGSAKSNKGNSNKGGNKK